MISKTDKIYPDSCETRILMEFPGHTGLPGLRFELKIPRRTGIFPVCFKVFTQSQSEKFKTTELHLRDIFRIMSTQLRHYHLCDDPAAPVINEKGKVYVDPIAET